ncbi:MAG: rod shape-determining protein MreD [Chloroflexota bacterium]
MNRSALYYFMIPLLLLGGLIQSTAGVRLMVLGVKPDIVLMLILVGSVVYGAQIGIVWAFIGGLILDTFSGGPMGSSSLALIGAAFVAGLGHETLSRFNFFVPLSAAILGTLIYDGLYLSILAILGRDIAWQATIEGVVLPSVIYNTMIMLLLIPLLNRMPESHMVGYDSWSLGQPD